MNATSKIDWPNLRLLRAQSLVARILSVIDPYLCDHMEEVSARREVHDALIELFAGIGVDIVTDYDRQEAGLPPRAPNGWTVEELIALEKRRLDALYAPVTVHNFPVSETRESENVITPKGRK